MPNEWLRSLENAIGIRLERERADTQRKQFSEQLLSQQADREQRGALAAQQLANEAEDRKLRARQLDQAEKAQRAAETMSILGMESRGEVRRPMAPLGATGVSVPELGINPTEQSNQFGVVPVGPEAQILNRARANVQVKAEERNMILGELEAQANKWSQGDPDLRDMYMAFEGNIPAMTRPEAMITWQVMRDPANAKLPISKKLDILASKIDALTPRSNAGDASMILAGLQVADRGDRIKGLDLYNQALSSVMQTNPGIKDDQQIANLMSVELAKHRDPKNLGAYAVASDYVRQTMRNVSPRGGAVEQILQQAAEEKRLKEQGQQQQPQQVNPQRNQTTPPPPPRANSTPAPAPDPKGFDLRDIANRAERAKQMRARGIYNVNP
jgi:hypothetical protein